MAPPAWNVLVVDDEMDMHNITRIALRRKTWRDRPVVLTSAQSGEAARKILEASDAPSFHCALVDVVMETNDAGLRLCDFIRTTVPRTTRIILRTGQPGAAPPEKVMNDYDIDYYLAKTEVTEDRLFTTLRACFRSSLDIAALLAVGSQLRGFTLALQDVATTQETLAGVMRKSLGFLEEKYGASVVFVADASNAAASGVDPALCAAVGAAHDRKLPPMVLHPGASVGLPDGALVLTATLPTVDRTERSMGEKVKRWFQGLVKEQEDEPRSGIRVTFERELPEKTQREFLQDLELLVANWRVAETSLRLQDRIVRDRMEMMKHYRQT